jgi:hypothetical protein
MNCCQGKIDERCRGRVGAAGTSVCGAAAEIDPSLGDLWGAHSTGTGMLVECADIRMSMSIGMDTMEFRRPAANSIQPG